MDANFKPLFSTGRLANSLLPARLTAENLNMAHGIYEQNVGLQVTREDARREPKIQTLSMNLERCMAKSTGAGISAGTTTTTFVASSQGKDYVDRQAPPELVMSMESRLDISKLDEVDVPSGMHWTLREENEPAKPDGPIKAGDPKQG
ncbi:uncharacterized protein PV07_03493 [Cladophialophora immunda]|uniref:Uncharacterized protein n=1 Tax=Cladophialophora immunda TaxID=569365 RepID=A0A0D2CPH2_9EURO|nr:uncharacterized protein PV07_03493 [Cladophialophora immunda]KIW31905.1 hypothetical protein PV07_03493 [Cladophialophora immunda]OQU98368.1 hypothetical protein CLAIMM_04164 [Cladophialophora immunda]